MKINKHWKEFDELYDKYYKQAQKDKSFQVWLDEEYIKEDKFENGYGAMQVDKPYFVETTHMAIPRLRIWTIISFYFQFNQEFYEEEIKLKAYLDIYRHNL